MSSSDPFPPLSPAAVGALGVRKAGCRDRVRRVDTVVHCRPQTREGLGLAVVIELVHLHVVASRSTAPAFKPASTEGSKEVSRRPRRIPIARGVGDEGSRETMVLCDFFSRSVPFRGRVKMQKRRPKVDCGLISHKLEDQTAKQPDVPPPRSLSYLIE